MLKKITVFSFVALNFLSSFSAAFAIESNVFNHPVLPENLAQIEKIIPQPSLLRGNFEQMKTVKGSTKKFISQGNFLFAKNSGLYWSTTKPFPSTIVFAKGGLLKIENGNKEIISANSSPFFEEFSQIFQSVFSGDTKKIQDGFDVFFENDKKNNWVLGLRTNNDAVKSVITEIVIKGSKNTEEIILKEHHGDSTVIKLKNVTSNQKPLSKDEAAYFKF